LDFWIRALFLLLYIVILTGGTTTSWTKEYFCLHNMYSPFLFFITPTLIYRKLHSRTYILLSQQVSPCLRRHTFATQASLQGHIINYVRTPFLNVKETLCYTHQPRLLTNRKPPDKTTPDTQPNLQHKVIAWLGLTRTDCAQKMNL
jgi:hypothetical protein